MYSPVAMYNVHNIMYTVQNINRSLTGGFANPVNLIPYLI